MKDLKMVDSLEDNEMSVENFARNLIKKAERNNMKKVDGLYVLRTDFRYSDLSCKNG
jgi:hypothetical protein